MMNGSRFGIGSSVAIALVLCTTVHAAVEERRTISTSGNAAVQVAPDEVIITLGVETNSMEIQAARQENDDKVRAVLAAAEKHGVPRQHLQTAFLTVEPRWENLGTRRTFLGYWCNKTLVVRLKDMTRYEQILTDALTAGANYIYGIDFRTTELRKHRDSARQMAIRAAREKAVALASELNLGIGSARMVSEGGGGWGMPTYRSGGLMVQNQVQSVASSRDDSGDSALAPGQISITADVSVTFDLETTGTASAR